MSYLLAEFGFHGSGSATVQAAMFALGMGMPLAKTMGNQRLEVTYNEAELSAL